MKALAREHNMPMRILEAVDYINEAQKQIAFKKLNGIFDRQLGGKTIAVWGLAFKPETDDIREAPALVLIGQLLEAGAQIRAYDAQALHNVRERLGESITYCDDMYEAVEGVDALVIMTEWDEFSTPNFGRIRSLMVGNVIVDGRNMFDTTEIAQQGFTYSSIGRQTTGPTCPMVVSSLLPSQTPVLAE